MKRKRQNKLKLNIQLFAYDRKYWKDSPDLSTPIRATDLNNLEASAEAQDTQIFYILSSLGLDKSTWEKGKSYAVGDQVIYMGNLYECTTANSDENFNKYNWDIISFLDEDKKFNEKLYIYPNAGSHDSIYRGKNITDAFYNGEVSKNIKNGTFSDIFVGDYIIGKTSKRKYIVADIDYYLHTGDTECKTHHLVMVPEQVMGNARMNATNTTAGAYVGSEMYTTNLAAYKSVIEGDFGSDHMLTHRNIFANTVANGIETAGTWANSCVELMNEINVYGSNIFHNVGAGTTLPFNYETDNSQFALFRFDRTKLVAFNGNNRQWYWLRSVVNSASFALGSGGGSSYAAASHSGGVRPAFTIY